MCGTRDGAKARGSWGASDFMPISIRTDLDSGVAIVACSGSLQLRDAKAAARSLWRTKDWNGDAALWDFRHATFDLSTSDIREIAHFVLHNQPSRPPRKMAFVVTRDVDFGMARMFDAFREDPNTQFGVFRDCDEALSWARVHESGDGRPPSPGPEGESHERE